MLLGVDWQVVGKYVDVTRSYRAFQNPNSRAGANKKLTLTQRLRRMLTSCLGLPRRMLGLSVVPKLSMHESTSKGE